MNEQPLDDDAELLRSLKPTRPEIDWQKVLSQLPESSVSQEKPVNNPLIHPMDSGVTTHVVLADHTVAEPRLKRLVSSWWSGALAGSLITFALLRLAGTPAESNRPQDDSVAQAGSSASNEPPRSIENSTGSSIAVGNEPPSRARRQRDGEGWDLSVDSSVWSSRFKRHGLTEKLVSKSTASAVGSNKTYQSSLHSSDDFPKSQAVLCRELLDFN